MKLPEGIIFLDYSERQRLFHFDTEPQKKALPEWIQLMAMSYNDAIEFCSFMEKKYVDNRSSGVLPELSVVKLELALFNKLKTTRRKYSGR